MGSRVALLAGLAVVAMPRAARADDNDLVLARLANKITDGTGAITSVVPDQVAFRSLASQLGVVLAPHLLTPADTIGFGGFQLTVDASTTTIDSSAPYWRALERTSPAPSSLSTVGVFVRKGLWLPLPSFEVGVGAVHLGGSTTWAAQLYTKLSLHEGYHDLPLPSVAFRAGVSRMMNQRELDLTVVSLDVTLSKHFGVAGTWRLDPFVGGNELIIVPRSEVLDPTPNVDSLAPGNEADGKLDFVFRDEANIFRTRVFGGVKAQYSFVQLTLELDVALAGSSVDDRTGTTDACVATTPTTTNCDTKDTAKAQTTLSLSAGFDF